MSATGALATLAAKSSAQNAYMSCLLANHGDSRLQRFMQKNAENLQLSGPPGGQNK
jgi:hypothetical protein